MCIQTGRLCQNCEDLFDEGEIADIDIDFGKILMDAAKSHKFLSKITVNNIIETKNRIILIVKKGDKEKFLRAKKYLSSQFSKVDERSAVYLEKTRSAKQLLEDILSPIIPMGTSTIFLPSFSEKELKVQVKKADKESIMAADELSVITKAILGMNAHYAYV